jgi:hypothetical protein
MQIRIFMARIQKRPNIKIHKALYGDKVKVPCEDERRRNFLSCRTVALMPQFEAKSACIACKTKKRRKVPGS